MLDRTLKQAAVAVGVALQKRFQLLCVAIAASQIAIELFRLDDTSDSQPSHAGDWRVQAA